MPVLRNRLASARSGGPRQYSEIRDMLMVSLDSRGIRKEVEGELESIGYRVRTLSGPPVIIAEPKEDIADVLQKFMSMEGRRKYINTAIEEVRDAVENGDDIIDASAEALGATRSILRSVRSISGVRSATFAFTEADYGPENLRMGIEEMGTINPSEVDSYDDTLGDLNKRLGLEEAWEKERGDQAVVAIFDTGFAEGIIDEPRIIGKFHGGGTTSVYHASEGHGTMCAGASAANREEEPPFNGAAPDAEVILVRITDEEGQIRSDIIADGWDYIDNMTKDKPVVTNHSYGTPLCSGRPRTSFCDTPQNDIVSVINEDEYITSLYAAGNEAMQCGHRPSGLTNGITGTNSMEEVITVGALRFDGNEAQRYSSHGRGDCAPIADPKPNVSCALPMKTYYGGDNGWEVKDMGMGVGGSSGGTSHATPTTTGMVALLQSRAMKERGEPLETEEVKQILRESASVPHINQINIAGMLISRKGYDARFGYGQVDINEALSKV